MWIWLECIMLSKIISLHLIYRVMTRIQQQTEVLMGKLVERIMSDKDQIKIEVWETCNEINEIKHLMHSGFIKIIIIYFQGIFPIEEMKKILESMAY